MPESMYDKLGDLLHAALDSGFILREKKHNFSANQKENSKENSKETFDENHKKEKSDIPENVKTAFSKLQIPKESDFKSAKKIFREKLKFYHPDRRNDNPVLQKVAKEKTEQLLICWEIIETYFKSL